MLEHTRLVRTDLGTGELPTWSMGLTFPTAAGWPISHGSIQHHINKVTTAIHVGHCTVIW